MLTLHRNANTIVTDENFSVKLKWVNPACYFDAVPGDVGLGLEISVNEYTRAEFGNPERFEKYTTGQDRKFPGVSIRFGGAILMAGTLVITNASRETYSGWLQSELGVLGTAQRDKFINEMAWTSGVTFANKAEYVPGTDEYACVKIHNPNFWEGKGFEEEVEVTYNDEFGNPQTKTITQTHLTKIFIGAPSSGIVNNMESDGTIKLPTEASVISPFLFLNFMLTELFRINKMYVDQTNNPLADPDFQLLVYNNYNIIKQIITTSEQLVWTLDPRFNTEYYEEIQQVETMIWELGEFAYKDLIPNIALKDLILWLQNWLNIAFVFQSDNIVKVVNRNDISDAVPHSIDNYFLGYWNIGERKNVTLKFIQELDKDDELVSSDWHDLGDRRADFKDPVDTIATLKALVNPSPGELRYVYETNSIYEYKWGVFTATNVNLFEIQIDVYEWTLASVAPQPFFYGEAEEIEEIKTGCSILNDTGGSLIYETLQKGNVSISRSLWSDFSLRCLLQNDFAYDQPRGRLHFDGELGIFKTRWEKWARFWKNRLPVEGEFLLPLNELYYVINHITEPYSTRSGKFIIEEMECDFQGSQMGLVKIKGYKLD